MSKELRMDNGDVVDADDEDEEESLGDKVRAVREANGDDLTELDDL